MPIINSDYSSYNSKGRGNYSAAQSFHKQVPNICHSYYRADSYRV